MNTLETAAPCLPSRSCAPGTEWRPDFASIRGRVYLAIASQIEQAVLTGVLRPGDRLPSQRAIADDLGFHVNTVNRAFREAARRGFVRGCTRRGTVVSIDAHKPLPNPAVPASRVPDAPALTRPVAPLSA